MFDRVVLSSALTEGLLVCLIGVHSMEEREKLHSFRDTSYLKAVLIRSRFTFPFLIKQFGVVYLFQDMFDAMHVCITKTFPHDVNRSHNLTYEKPYYPVIQIS